LAVAGSKIYVAEYFSDSLAVVDLDAGPGAPVTAIALGQKPRLTAVRRGELLFNDATICYQHWQSCASCHPDGRSDALNWDLLNDGVGNPKNTKSMLLAHQTPPAMSEGVRLTAEAAVRSGLTHILFADRPEDQAAAIDEYLKSLRPMPSPHLVDGQLSPAAQRGKKLFESQHVGCHACHPAPLYTDLKVYRVGSRGPADYVDAFDTPTLVEVWRTAPYLHDGRYATIRELLVEGQHGRGEAGAAALSQQDLADLVAFVLSL
jgi:cytochrome c peroxidase